MSDSNTFAGLIERWRINAQEDAIAAKAHRHLPHAEMRDHRNVCADELSALEQHYIHKDKVRELRKLCQIKLSTASLPTDEELLRWFIDWLTALLGGENERVAARRNGSIPPMIIRTRIGVPSSYNRKLKG